MKKSTEIKFAARKVLLAKMKLPDHAQLLPKFLSKKIFKNFENFRKIFLFFRMEIFWDFRNFDFRFSIWFSMKKSIFRNFRNFRNFRKFSKFSKFPIFQNIGNFRKCFRFFHFLRWFFYGFQKFLMFWKVEGLLFPKSTMSIYEICFPRSLYSVFWKSMLKQVPGCFFVKKTSLWYLVPS